MDGRILSLFKFTSGVVIDATCGRKDATTKYFADMQENVEWYCSGEGIDFCVSFHLPPAC